MLKQFSDPIIVNFITGFALVISGLLVMKYETPSLQVVGVAMMWIGSVVLAVSALLAALGMLLESRKAVRD